MNYRLQKCKDITTDLFELFSLSINICICETNVPSIHILESARRITDCILSDLYVCKTRVQDCNVSTKS